MSLLQRSKNVFCSLYSLFVYETGFLGHGEAVKHLLPPGSLSVHEAFDKVSIVFVNQHPATDYVIPSLPFIRSVGGLHIKEGKAKLLSKDLEDFISGSENGFIFVSFGSIVPSDKMPEKTKQALVEAFSRIPQRVVWRYKGTIPNLSPNVKLVDWIPQQTIFAHPKIKAFISHGGLFSYHEAVYHGVPIIGFPVFSDQPYNLNRAVSFGFGIKLTWDRTDGDDVVRAIETVVNDKSYKARVMERSQLFKDNPVHPLDEAVYWIEYLVRHPGTLHLRPDLGHLNLAQYLLLDVIGLVALVLLVFVFITYKVIRLCLRTAFGKSHKGKGISEKKKK